MEGLKIEHSRLRELLEYNPETGVFTRKYSKRSKNPNRIAGSVDKLGYRYLMVDGTTYPAHHLAWFWVTKTWPEGELDHKNGVRDDNSFGNLRPASHHQNMQNRGRPSNNKSGFKGVCAEGSKWRAYIGSNGKRYSLGTYDSPEETHAAYRKAARHLNGEFARTE
jgi:hypothetical protein